MNDIHETLRAAESGDTGAMLELSEYYFLAEPSDIENAQKWADAAAEAGVVGGYLISMRLHALTARAGEAMKFCELAIDEWRIVLSRAERLTQALREGLKLSEEQRRGVFGALDDARYGIARSEFYKSDASEAACGEIIASLRDVQTAKARMLCGVCSAHRGEYPAAYRFISEALRDGDYAASQKEIGEEGIYTEAVADLAAFYRAGMPGVVERDLDAAVRTLTNGCKTVRDEDLLGHLRSELARYQKKLFGGYKYV